MLFQLHGVYRIGRHGRSFTIFLLFIIIIIIHLVCEAIGTAVTPDLLPASGDSEDDCGEADGM
jgi:hypothetical protein